MEEVANWKSQSSSPLSAFGCRNTQSDDNAGQDPSYASVYVCFERFCT